MQRIAQADAAPDQPPAAPAAAMLDAGAGSEAEPAPVLAPAHSSLAPLRLPIHVDARGLALGIIATVVFVHALQWSQKFLVPLLLGIFIAYTLNPVVAWLARIGVRRAAGATLVTALILGASALVVYRVQDEFVAVIDDLPKLTQKLTRLLTSSDGQPGAIAQVQAAAREIEQATARVGETARAPARKGASAPAAGHAWRVLDWVWAGSVGAIGFLMQATMVLFLVYFLLLSGDTFKRKLVKLTGPSLTRKRITVHILDDINTSIQSYMFMLLVTNSLLALLMWATLRAIGLENAGAWAIFAGVLHLMPYFGPLLITAATGLVAFMQFESLRMALLAMGAALVIAAMVGMLVTTWMSGKIARMNPAAVFVSLLFWGWLWGVWGLLLGVPVIFIVKVVAERVEGLEALAELLGE